MRTRQEPRPVTPKICRKKSSTNVIDPSGSELKDIFIRKHYQQIVKHAHQSLSNRTKKRITSWVGFSKLMIKARRQFGPKSPKWEKIRTLTRNRGMDLREGGCYSTRELSDKVENIMERVEKDDIQGVIEEIEENTQKRKNLSKSFFNELKIIRRHSKE